MKDYRTTYAGIGAILIAVGGVMSSMFDADPVTVPDWGTAIAAILAGFGLIFAKDAKGSDA